MTDVTTAIRWMFHSTAMVADYDDAVDRLALLAGLRVLEYSANTQPEIGRRGGMTWVGDGSIEIGQPIVDTGGAARFVARTGGGVHSIAVQVADVEASMRHVEACGVRVAARPMPEFFFTDPRDTDGVFIEWGAFELHVDPHFGAQTPPHTVEPLFDLAYHAFVGAIVHDPLATASRLVQLFGTAITFRNEHASPGEPVVGVSLGDCTLALFAMPGEHSEAWWGRAYTAPRTHLLGFGVVDLQAAQTVLLQNGFTTVRRTDSMIVLDPATTGGIQVALVDRLFPGDPRVT